MRYEIDQSIKVEDTAKTTYVALSNSSDIVVSISSKDKKALKKHFRSINKPLTYKLFTFSALCAKTILHLKLKKEDLVTIDIEYPGYNRNIKYYITAIIKYHRKEAPDLIFQEVGKRSRAHRKVYKAFKAREKGVMVDAKWILKLTGCLSNA
jgi:hypothetical protein